MINDNQASYIHIAVWQYSMARISRFSDSIEDLHSDTALCLSSIFCFLVWLRPEFSINPVPSGSFKKIYAAWKAMLFCKNTKTPVDALAQTYTCLGTRGKSRKSMKVIARMNSTFRCEVTTISSSHESSKLWIPGKCDCISQTQMHTTWSSSKTYWWDLKTCSSASLLQRSTWKNNTDLSKKPSSRVEITFLLNSMWHIQIVRRWCFTSTWKTGSH